MLLLRADQVLTGRPGERYAGGDVLVDGRQIVHVGARGSAPADAESAVVELPGCTVLPGLIDSHVHLGFDRTVDWATRRSRESDAHLVLRMAENCRKLLAVGVTTARDLGCRDFLDVEVRDAIEAGLAVGPHLVLATRPITNTGGHCWYMGGEADDVEAVRRVARENLRAGADCLKIMATGGAMTPVGPPAWTAQFSTDLLRVAADEAAMRGKTVAAHAHGAEGIARALDAEVSTIEHCSFVGPEGIRGRPRVDHALVDAIAAKGIIVCPTVSGAMWRMRDLCGPEWFDACLGWLSGMRTAGVKLAAGTDSGFGSPTTGAENRMDDYVSGLEVFAAAGWDNAAVLEAATVFAAEACGVADVTGTLEVGKRADLVVVQGDPLTDLDSLRQIERVLVAGREVTQTHVATVASSGGLE